MHQKLQGVGVGGWGGAVESVITKIRSWWSKFRDLLPLLTSKDLSLEAKDRLHSTCIHIVMLYGSETLPVKEENVIRQWKYC